MGLLFENISMAISSIKANKMRSFLTMLGIVIGISSVITISSLGDSINITINKFFSTFGKNRIMINISPDDPSYQFTYSDLITLDDISVLKERFPDTIKYISPWVSTDIEDVEKNGQKAKGYVSGIDYNYFDYISGYDFLHGRSLSKKDIQNHEKNAIVSDEFAKKLFFKTNVVGETIHAKGRNLNDELTIIGVYHKDKTIFDSMGSGDRTEIFVPYSTFSNFTENWQLDALLDKDANLAESTQKINNFLNRYKQKDGQFYKSTSLDEQVAMINSVLGMLSLGLGAIAAISLVVGGIGIMNIMLVSVTERTKEIGIRKSLGARKKDILSQFLIESMILSGLGGVFGTVLGVLLSTAFTMAIKTDFIIPIKSILIAVGFSAAVGVFFGLYPANKAAKLDPIDALKYE